MTPQPRRTSAEDKRAAILDAALELFVERGFHGTAVPEIAAKARVAAGTIYHYFDSKEAIVNAIYMKHKTEIANLVFSGFPVDVAPRELFRTMWTRMARFVVDHPTAFFFLELHHHGPYLDEQSRGLEQRLNDFAIQFIESAQKSQALRPGPPQLLFALVNGAFVGLARANREGRLALTPENLELAERACWELVRA